MNEVTLDRIEVTDQVLTDAWFMTFPEFVNYYRDINGFSLRSRGGTHNLDKVYHQIINDLASGKKILPKDLTKNSHSKWFREKKIKPTTRPYTDILNKPTIQEEEDHQKQIVDKITSPNSKPISKRQLARLKKEESSYLQINSERLKK